MDQAATSFLSKWLLIIFEPIRYLSVNYPFTWKDLTMLGLSDRLHESSNHRERAE
jgi:hypothetical protein